jgi:hypothetical protein
MSIADKINVLEHNNTNPSPNSNGWALGEPNQNPSSKMKTLDAATEMHIRKRPQIAQIRD